MRWRKPKTKEIELDLAERKLRFAVIALLETGAEVEDIEDVIGLTFYQWRQINGN